jgi:hypothetical protein
VRSKRWSDWLENGSRAMYPDPRNTYVPHFEVATVDAGRVRYRDIWQRRNLVLVALAQRPVAERYAAHLRASRHEFDEADADVVVTTDSIPGLPAAVVVVADRWGEIQHLEPVNTDVSAQLPSVREILAWVQFVQMQCPECPP